MTSPINTDAQLDIDFRDRLRAATVHDTTPHWQDVQRRAQTLDSRPPRRRLALGLAVAAVIVAAPAFAIATGAIDFSSAPSAPEPVKVIFGKLDAIDPLHGPGALTGQTRIVYTFHTASGSYDLAAAPSRDGWCWGIVHRDMTCNTPDSGLNYGYNQLPAVGNKPPLIDGSIAAAGVTRITLKSKTAARSTSRLFRSRRQSTPISSCTKLGLSIGTRGAVHRPSPPTTRTGP